MLFSVKWEAVKKIAAFSYLIRKKAFIVHSLMRKITTVFAALKTAALVIYLSYEAP